MDAFLAHKRLVAADARRAQPIAGFHHRYLSRRPLVLCCYHLAGDPGAPLGFVYGTDPDSPQVIVVGEPRNRDLRFRALERLANDFNDYFGGFRTRQTVLDRNGGQKFRRDGTELMLADEAPQLVVPNSATADWLGLLARSTVWLQTEGEFAVQPSLPVFGAHLTYLTSRRKLPGSANILAATELLDLHWTTGQTDFEDANLATLLSWIDERWLDPEWFNPWVPPPDGCEAARLAESLPSAGPVPDPVWDTTTLEPLVEAFNSERRVGRQTDRTVTRLRAAVLAALTPAWIATWRAIGLVRALPEAASVSVRWDSDRWSWTNHLHRAEAGRAFFRRHLTAIQSARLLGDTEDAAAGLAAAMAIDDPLVMARSIAAGDAVEGLVIERDDSHFEMGPSGRRRVSRPIIRMAADDPLIQPIGTSMIWAADTRVRGEIHRLPEQPGDPVEIKIIGGMRNGALPNVGDRGCFTTLVPPTRYGDTLPETAPWTHTLPQPVEVEGDVA